SAPPTDLEHTPFPGEQTYPRVIDRPLSTLSPLPSCPDPSDFPAGRSSPRDPSFFQEAARLGVQAAEALEHAHQIGIIHRDVKPGNLLLDTRGELWVTDFGLARWSNEGTLTSPGSVLGTMRYMSPEQASGGQRVVDHRTDIYSLGATLYELLTL